MEEVIVISNVNIQGIIKDVKNHYGDDIIEKVMGHTLSYMDDMIIDYEGVERSDFFQDNVDPFLDEILTYHKIEFYDDLYEDNPNVDDLYAEFKDHLTGRLSKHYTF